MDKEQNPLVLVIHYCIIKYHKLSSLKQHPLVIYQFLCIRNLTASYWVLCLGVHKTVVRVLIRPHIHLEAKLDMNPFPASLRLLADFLSFWL